MILNSLCTAVELNMALLSNVLCVAYATLVVLVEHVNSFAEQGGGIANISRISSVLNIGLHTYYYGAPDRWSSAQYMWYSD